MQSVYMKQIANQAQRKENGTCSNMSFELLRVHLGWNQD